MEQIANFVHAYLPSFAVDVTGVYDQNFNQLFRHARALKANIKDESKTMEHPLETGATVVDHRIILPMEIELSCLVTSDYYRDIYQQIKQVFKQADLLTVQTKAASYENMIIASFPHEENSEQFDIILIAIKLKEVQFSKAVSTEAIKPRKNKNKTTVDRGEQSSSEAGETKTKKSSLLFRAFN